MDPLFTFHANVIRQISDSFTRFLYEKVNWNQRMLALKGPRGAGKTTLMLQYIKYGLKLPANKALYISADHYWFYNHTLFETAESFYLNGGRHLFIDEVHRYPQWAREMKNIYDGFPELKIVFSASSALDIFRGEADLSRRVIAYSLPGMSFREYLMLSKVADFEFFELSDIVSNHEEIVKNITDQIQPLPYFRNYLKYGYLPIITESLEGEIPVRLNQVINAIVESDLAYIEGFDSGTANKIKKLLGVIAESVPFKPNVSALARKLDISRESVYAWLNYLEKGRLLNTLKQKGKGVSTLQKPDKIYLENTNLAYALKENPDIGSIRLGGQALVVTEDALILGALIMTDEADVFDVGGPTDLGGVA
ncbi:MAG: AAA family ATPase, partial [Balneolaceae bacterium]|nr:AAA family ATPase [Balneolaceae bacterium]